MEHATALHLLRNARHPVVFFSNGIGDVFLTLPALRALADLYPGRLTLICEDWAAQLCYARLPLARLVSIEVRREATGRAFDVGDVVSRVPACDAFLSLNQWMSPSLMTCMRKLAPAVTVSYYQEFDIACPTHPDAHAADEVFQIPRLLEPDLQLEDYVPPSALAGDARHTASDIRALLPADSIVVAVHADTLQNKTWPHEKFVQLIDHFLGQHPASVAVVVGPRYENWEGVHDGARLIPCYGLSLSESCALVEHADVFVGIDSCMLHVADLAGVPGVGLFGSTNVKRWGFRFTPHRHVVAEGGRLETVEVARVLCELNKVAEGVVGRRGRAAADALVYAEAKDLVLQKIAAVSRGERERFEVDLEPGWRQRRVCRVAEVEERVLGQHEVELWLGTRGSFVLNRSALSIWELCDGKRTVDEVAGELGEALGCSKAALLPDVCACVAQLARTGFVALK